jgi:predicted transcriptional regulator
MTGPRARLSRFELELMEVFWARSPVSIREVHEQLPEDRRPAYTTVQTIVNRLEEKGAVERVRKIGNAHVYRPVLSREAAWRTLIADFLGLFGGSPRRLMARLVETGQLSLRDIRELERTCSEGERSPAQERPVAAREAPVRRRR